MSNSIDYIVCMSAEVPARSRRRRPRLSDEAAEHVRELIVSGRLEPGQFIRPETMAAELDISATPMREGLLTLQSEGLLRVEPRRGFMVAPLSAADIEDVFTGQSLLAGELAARATSRMGDEDLDALAAIQAELEHAADTADYDEVERLNHVFHRMIYSAADSPKLSWMIKGSLNYAPRRFFASVEGWPQASAADHRAIIAGLRARDAEGARAAMVAHIRNAGHLLAAQR